MGIPNPDEDPGDKATPGLPGLVSPYDPDKNRQGLYGDADVIRLIPDRSTGSALRAHHGTGAFLASKESFCSAERPWAVSYLRICDRKERDWIK